MSEVEDLRCPDCGAVAWYYQNNEDMPSSVDPGETYYYTRRVTVRRRQDGRLDVGQSFDDMGGYMEDEIELDQQDISCEECNESNPPERIFEIVNAALAHFGDKSRRRIYHASEE